MPFVRRWNIKMAKVKIPQWIVLFVFAIASNGWASDGPTSGSEEYTPHTGAARGGSGKAAASNDNAEPKSRLSAFWDKVLQEGRSKLQDIELHGRVQDQHGRPVAGVKIVYDAGGIYLAESSGRGTTMSNDRGMFLVKNARGVDLWIDSMTKPGYEFRKSEGEAGQVMNPRRFHSQQWKAYSRSKPAVFVVWHMPRLPSVKTGTRNLYMAPGAGPYTGDFLAGDKMVFEQGARPGDVRFSFVRSDERWSLRIEAVNGGLQEHDDVYPFLAPNAGYQPVVEYQFRRSQHYSIHRKLFFRSRDGEVHGALGLQIAPYFNDEDSAIRIDYVVNLEKGRDLGFIAK